jgi:hypothetical protein
VRVEQHGRHRYYRIAGPAVVDAIEALALLAPPSEVRSLREDSARTARRDARLCYDHVAGRLGVALLAVLRAEGVVMGHDGSFRLGTDRLSARGTANPYTVGDGRSTLLDELGVDAGAVAADRGRAPLSFCVDWSEQRHHLGSSTR